MLRMGVGLFVGVWLARFLGPERFGLWNFTIAFVSLFSAIAALGLDGIVVRDLVRDPSSKDEILGTAFVLKLLGGSLTLFLVLASFSLIRPQDKPARWLGLICRGG